MKLEKSWKAWVGLIEVSALAMERFAPRSGRVLGYLWSEEAKLDFRLQLGRETVSSIDLDLHVTSAIDYGIEQTFSTQHFMFQR